MAAPLEHTQAREEIQALIERYDALSSDERSERTEASVVQQFIEPLLKALGWPLEEPGRYHKELYTETGRPDLTLTPEKGGNIFVEAKRFGSIKELKEARKTITGIVTPGQLSLPGMANDRTIQEQQAINYAHGNNAKWAILTNFEKLRLFNAKRDWLVLSFERPSAYIKQFDTLWQLSYESILNGELDRLSNQRHREDVDADYLNFINEYRQLLAQDVIAHSGANRWAFIGDSDQVNLPLLRDVVQRFLDRLVVVRFAEDHYVLPPGELRKLIEANRSSDYGNSLRNVMQIFFRKFDEQHNSTLFAHHPIVDEQADFSEDLIAKLVDRLYQARYRSMPADIMGNTYEQYLGQTLVQVNGSVETRSNLETRKKQGSYYTPQVIVRYLVDNSLGRYLYGTANGKADGEPVEGETRKTYQQIADLRVLDPACGSGSFLIYAYQVLAEFYRAELKRVRDEADAYAAQRAQEGISPLEIEGVKNTFLEVHLPTLNDYPRRILEQHIYGVDLDPQAAELAAVNLIFRAMEDQRRMRSKDKLPLILNQNVKTGNALIGVLDTLPEGVTWEELAPDLAELRTLRQQLITGEHDDVTMQQIAEVEGRVNAKLDARLNDYFDDPTSRRPLNWAVAFPEVFVDEDGTHRDEDAGFDVIVGNPPWEIVKPDLREYYSQFDADIESRLSRNKVEARIKELNADKKIKAGWETQKAHIEANAAYFKATTDYTRQYRGDTALHKLFVERVWNMLATEGRLGYVVPSGIYTDLGTKELREMLLNEGHIQYLYSFSNERFFFPGVDHRFKFAMLGAQHGVPGKEFWAAFRFNPRVAVHPDELESFLATPENLVRVRNQSIEHFSPNSLSLMEFKTQLDYDVVAKIYADIPLLGDESENHWYVRLNNEFHMTNDRAKFNTKGEGLPLYQGRMIHQYDAAYSEPEFWISEDRYRKLNSEQRQQLDSYRIVHRRIASSTNATTLIAAIIPKHTASEVNATVALIDNADGESTKLFALTQLNSFVLDYVIRYKISTTLNMFYMYQLPLPRLTEGNPYFDALVPRAAQLTCTTPAFADLWQEVMGEPWDESKGATAVKARQVLRDEIDALVAHLYGLSRADFEHILGTFPLVFPEGEAGQQKKETLLAVYDQFTERVEGWARA